MTAQAWGPDEGDDRPSVAIDMDDSDELWLSPTNGAFVKEADGTLWSVEMSGVEVEELPTDAELWAPVE